MSAVPLPVWNSNSVSRPSCRNTPPNLDRGAASFFSFPKGFRSSC